MEGAGLNPLALLHAAHSEQGVAGSTHAEALSWVDCLLATLVLLPLSAAGADAA